MAAIPGPESHLPEESRRTGENAFDLLKGIGILEVFIHHSFSSSSRKFYAEGSAEWWALMLVNRVLHFAIPTFLLASAILLARSLNKSDRFDLRRYANRRLWRTVWPYLVWSAIYILFRVYVIRNDDDVESFRSVWFGITLEGPRALADMGLWGRELLWGKAYFHLYFLVVLIQLSLILPVLVWLVRGKRIGFGAIVAISAVLQIAVFVLQSVWWRAPYPASLAVWYVPALLIGTWLGVNWSQWNDVWMRNRGWIMMAAVLFAPIYLWFGILNLKGEPLSSFAFNASFAVYSASIALLLLGFATSFRSQSRLFKFVVAAGALSLPLFVIHPLTMYALGGPRLSAILQGIPLVPLLALAATFAITFLVAKILISLRLDVVLFGRNYRWEGEGG